MSRRTRLLRFGALLVFCGALGCSRSPPNRESKSAASNAAPVTQPLAVVPPVYGTPTLYEGAIHVPAAAPKPAMDDALAALEKMTGHAFTVTEGPADSGIVLVRTADVASLLPGEVDALAGKGPEAFLIRSSDPKTLRIVASADAGLTNGLYFFVRELGVRWLLPADDWTVIPARSDIGLKIDRVVTPAFLMRWFAGTGGFGSPSPVDPKMSMRGRWDTWKRRNGFGGQYILGGHTGETFALQYRAVLEAHPEYLALVGGKRVKWSIAARLCVSNPAAVKLYVDDRIAFMKRTNSGIVSVEPGDQPGHCDCERCKAIGKGTESDQVFYLANQVAKAVAKELPGHGVSLLAYSAHAAPPNIPLEPNMYVMVAPEAYQHTGMSPLKLITAWRKRVEHLSVYTYWSLAEWLYDVPSFDWRDIPVDRARSYHAAGVEGLSLETSFGSGAMGLGLYLASRLLWDPSEDPAAIATDFLSNAFGAGAPAMRRLEERWATHFTLTPYELGASYADLAEAQAAAKGDAAALRRIADMQTYLHYLRLWYEYQGTGGTPGIGLRRERALGVIVWLYRNYDRAMVSSFRIKSLIVDRREHDATLKSEFDEHNYASAGWAAATKPVSSAELAQLMQDGARAYPPIRIDTRDYSPKLVMPKTPLPAQAPEASRRLVLAGAMDFEQEVLPGRPFEVEITVNKSIFDSFDQVTITNPAGEDVHTEAVPADGGSHTVRFDTAPGRYRCHVEDQKATFVIRAPAGTPWVMSNLVSTDLSPRVYFWVPSGVHQVAMYAPSVLPVELFDGDGHAVPSAGLGLISVPVPKGQDGRVWSFRGYKSWVPIRAFSVPQVFALSPDALLVPEDAAN
ncbi:MAG TPA: DUF4838 domain-containing protein [Polyangiaceae bacterium]|jgi:hypothetical protein|nr:DUF4838 domain-containing protein [Polyangiaceae bacterium]